ncbi:MarR family winged helix-turn-helix transcriptional regulator [Streptomyces sp. NBC_01190]|uniref:MarR family winged helix-turn-helix transcriptional regulator n=1 Tax=Streptomyces sp. NBC_01190 TaxID=2903767 RepID=UPI003863F771|nr:MarR family transcriptional regulator [Streptomyces sp. NBC_01190]
MPRRPAATPASAPAPDADAAVGASVREGAPEASGEEEAGASEASAEAGDLGIVDGLAQLSFLVQATLGKLAAEYGLSVIQLRLLGVLRDREPGMQELARHLGLDKSSMTGLVDRAERRGLVRRTPSPHDGRAVLVALTDQGHDLARTIEADGNPRIHALAAHLTPGQRSQLSLLATALVTGHTTL